MAKPGSSNPQQEKKNRKKAGKNEGVMPIVGIGASAGGLSALKTLFSKIPENTGIAYVVVVHLSPEFKSMLAELLQPHVKMPVIQVNRTLQLKPDHVFVIPPGANLNSIDTHLRLSKLEEERRARAPIDHFFRTLAKTHNGHAAGIILTGTGSDGTLGLKEIKEKGGLTIVQDPDEAEYDGMPMSAITTGLIDLVLPLAEIPSSFIKYLTTFPDLKSLEAEKVEDEEEAQILQKIYTQVRVKTGKDFTRYKPYTLLRRIQRRMQINQIVDLNKYLELIRSDPGEISDLSDDFLINVTNFFRDSDAFDYLAREIMPKILTERSNNSPVRVWSVGCATGEEAYSIAMLLLESAGRQDSPPEMQIFGTDLHEHSLKIARHGTYPGEIRTDVPPERIRRFFIKDDTGYRIRKEVRETVIFTPHNVLSDPPFSRLDMIVCRNLLIYLKREVQRDVFELFHYALNPGGILVLGTSENIEDRDLFRTVSKPHSVYSKKNVAGRELNLPVFLRIGERAGKQESMNEKARERYGSRHHRIIEKHGPPVILLNTDHQLLHISGSAGRYLKIPEGDFISDVFKLIRPELQMELRSALYLCREGKKQSVSKPVNISVEGTRKLVSIHVKQVEDPDYDEIYLVSFEEHTKPSKKSTPAAGPSVDGDYRHRIGELEQELQETRQRLQAIIEEYETSREEMKASNEELQSTNEELRSTMEELETSKEELQSLNEELSTLNQENRHKVDELSQMSSDLQNLLSSTDIATLFLDRHLNILRYTPALKELFNIRHADRGRPITDQTNRLGYIHLEQDARMVLKNLQPIEREVEDESGRSYFTRLLPYRSSEDRIEGIVITFIDITERKAMENELRERESRFRALVNASSYAIYRISPDWSEMRELDGGGSLTGDRDPNRDWLEKHVVEDDRPRVRKAIEEAIRSKSPVSLQYRMLQGDGSFGWTLARAVPIMDNKGEIIEWFGAASDISRQVNTEQALRESEEQRLIAFEAAGVGDWWMNVDTGELYWSPKVREMLGVGPGVPASYDLSDSRIHPEDRDKVRKGIEKATDPSGKGEYDLEFRITTPGRKMIWVRSRARVLEFPGQKHSGRYLYGAMTDITQQKKTLGELSRAKEAAEKAARVKENFLAHISHEIRTPLHAIQGLAHLLIKQDPKEEQLENLQTLKLSAENLSRLINDVLDFSKIESGKITIEKGSFSIREFIDKIIGMHAPIAREKNLELEVRIDSKVPEFIVTDQMVLSQVLHNLLSNAVKFTPRGKVELDIGYLGKKRKKHILEFSVSDTGIGIPVDKLDIIFDVFSQADSSTVRQYGGSGLGLAITTRYLELLGSRIMVESVSGKGSRFYFKLGVGSAEEAEPQQGKVDSETVTSADLQGFRGLIVEDDPYNRLILKQLLSMWNLSFDEVENGLQAYEKAQERAYQLILLDVHMPVMDGFEAARKIRALPGYKDVVIIALTADISEKIRQEVKNGLFTEVHIKPFEPEKINRRITAIARKSKKSPS